MSKWKEYFYLILFNYRKSIFSSFKNLNLIFIIWNWKILKKFKYYSKKNEKGFFQTFEIGNHIIITCYILEKGNSNIECFSKKYDTNGFYLNVNWKEIINLCPLKNYYSLYKFNYEKGIISCYSNNQLELFLIDSYLNYIKLLFL